MNLIPHTTKKVKDSPQKSGFLLVNKPVGPTSHDIIDQLRKITGIKQIGHAGTLDPFASGLLLVGIGEATKLLRHYVGLDKTYEAVLRLGATSDTQDRTGKIQETLLRQGFGEQARYKQDTITKLKIQKIIKSFIGKQKQIPPMYSAKKVGGKKLYELAREGKKIERKAQEIEIYDLKVKKLSGQMLHVNCHVSSGTYIRALAHDIGQALGCGAYLEELRRTAIGNFKLEDAISLRHPEAEGTRHKLREESRRIKPKRDSRDPSLRLRSVQDDVLSHLIPLKTVLVSGTFDGVHEGHKNYFQQARKLAEAGGSIPKLICIVGRASIVKKIKGQEPLLLAKKRIKLVKQCPDIDQVYLGIAGTDQKVYDFTASLKPDIIALGYDQKAYTKNLTQEMKKRGLTVNVKRLSPYKPKKHKNSLLNSR